MDMKKQFENPNEEWFVYSYYTQSGRPKMEDELMNKARILLLYRIVYEGDFKSVVNELNHCQDIIIEKNKRLKRVEIEFVHGPGDDHAWLNIGSQHLSLQRVKGIYLQQEQPMPDSTKLIELWHEAKEMLKEKDFRDDPWRLAYNAFMCGFGRGIAVNKQEQPEVIDHICSRAGIPAPFMDGNQWSILKGDDIQVGVVGFGDTKEDALVDFIKNIPIQQEQPQVADASKMEQPEYMIQWTGHNLKEVIDFTGKCPRFGEWFKSWEEYENYVHSHNDILKLFCDDGSHYEVPVGAWIVKTPDGHNVPSVAKYVQREQLEVDLEKEFAETLGDLWTETPEEVQNGILDLARYFWNKGYIAGKGE